MLVDSHCHLDFPDLAGELDAVIARAQAQQIMRIVTISTRVRQHDLRPTDAVLLHECFDDLRVQHRTARGDLANGAMSA